MSPAPASEGCPIYIGSKVSGTFQIRVLNPLPDKIYTYSHNPYPADPFDHMSYYTFNAY